MINTEQPEEKTAVSEAVKILSDALKNDPDYWITWQANITVQFIDSHFNKKDGKSIHDIANEAAENFLILLTED